MAVIEKQSMPKAEENALNTRMAELLNYDQALNCMRCGFCLPACPTYREMGQEASSPRGRIALMKAAADGLLQNPQVLEDQLNQCLGCRACETACPAGVHYGELYEQGKQAVEEKHARHRFWVRILRKLAFEHIFPYQKRMRILGGLIAFYQKSGLQRLVRKLGLIKLFPQHMQEMEAVLPETKASGVSQELGEFIPAKGEKIGTVGMFSGCIMDIMFLETNKNTVKLLSEAGFDVLIPKQQNCCGALHAHNGEREKAKALAKNNIRAFKEANVDFIASNAGGCGALLQAYNHLLDDEDEDMRREASWFAGRVKDVSELILDHSSLRDMGSLNERITYQSSCHLQNGMQVKDQPHFLLQSIKGAEYVPLFEGERCCGSAGIYNLVQPEMAGRILAEKMEHVRQTKADTLVTANPGCLLQMKAGIHKAGLSDKMRAVHIVDLLAEAKRIQ